MDKVFSVNQDRQQLGFTLIEILLAMSVFLGGVVGILAIFPRAQQDATESHDDAFASQFSESIYASLKSAMKYYSGNFGRYVAFSHDGVWYEGADDGVSDQASGTYDPEKDRDFFYLPENDGEWIWYPYSDLICDDNVGSPTFPVLSVDTGAKYVRRLGKTKLSGFDTSEDYTASETHNQYYFNFSVEKVRNSNELYLFSVYLYHGGVDDSIVPSDPDGKGDPNGAWELENRDDIPDAGSDKQALHLQLTARENQFIRNFQFYIGR